MSEIHGFLETLAITAGERINKLRVDGTIRPDSHLHTRLHLKGFRYNESGVHFDQSRWEQTTKDVWWGAPMDRAMEEIRDLLKVAWQGLPDHLRELPNAEVGLYGFFETIASEALASKELSPDQLRESITLLVRSLKQEALTVTVEADLVCIAILTQPLNLDLEGFRIHLRATRQEDFEDEQPIEFLSITDLRQRLRTSAMLEIKYEAPDASGWQRELERVVAVLQLFGVGDVGYTVVRFGSESLTSPYGGITTIENRSPNGRTYPIHAPDVKRLQHFWMVMALGMPEHLYFHRSENPQGVAATHFWYCRVLGRRGWMNEQIAEVIRALESLLLDSQGRATIASTLRERLSTLLAACGLARDEVSRTITCAYEVRSRYVHGDELSPRDQRKIDKVAGGIIPLFQRCLDYLRLALVATIAAGVEKQELIKAIDASRKARPEQLERIGNAFRAAVQE